MSIDRDKVTELLNKFRSYKFAVSNGIAPYQSEDMLGMPMGGGYDSRAPRGFECRGSTLPSIIDFQVYSRAVRLVGGAIDDVLSDDERDVIRLKYLERNKLTLESIADRKHMHVQTVKNIHRRALKNLSDALMFVDVPEIINLDELMRIG